MGLDNPLHIAFLVVVLLLVFGARRLPEMGRSIGEGMRGFKEAVTGEEKPSLSPGEQVQQAAPTASAPAAAPPAAPAAPPAAAPAGPPPAAPDPGTPVGTGEPGAPPR